MKIDNFYYFKLHPWRSVGNRKTVWLAWSCAGKIKVIANIERLPSDHKTNDNKTDLLTVGFRKSQLAALVFTECFVTRREGTLSRWGWFGSCQTQLRVSTTITHLKEALDKSIINIVRGRPEFPAHRQTEYILHNFSCLSAPSLLTT